MHGRNWEDSRANCLGYGADLVSILTSSESDFIYQQIRTNETIRTLTRYTGIWIGLFRNKTTGDQKEGWVWSDGNKFTNPEQWAVGQPSNHNNEENCARIYTDYEGWNDHDCAKLFSSICKKREGTLICVGFLYIIPNFLNCEISCAFSKN